jgi:hypothetical protein
LCPPHHKLIHSIFRKIEIAERGIEWAKKRLLEYPDSLGAKYDIEYYTKLLNNLIEDYGIK